MFVLVHGAWHGAWCWSSLQECANAPGGFASVALDLPGHGCDRTPLAELTLDAYADRVVQTLCGLDEPAILVGHSMGGIVISQAAERAPERVAGLVYLCAFLLPAGESILDRYVAQPDSELMAAVEISDDGQSTTVRPEAAPGLFYGDCTAEQARWAAGRLVPEPVLPVSTPLEVTPERWGAIPRAYVRCTSDRALSPEMQDELIGTVGVDEVVEMQTAHSPFLSRPRELASVLGGLGRRLVD